MRIGRLFSPRFEKSGVFVKASHTIISIAIQDLTSKNFQVVTSIALCVVSHGHEIKYGIGLNVKSLDALKSFRSTALQARPDIHIPGARPYFAIHGYILY
jgi:hypothetical protein